MRWLSVAAAVVGFASWASALDPIEAYGNKLFNKDGSQFFIKGESIHGSGELNTTG